MEHSQQTGLNFYVVHIFGHLAYLLTLLYDIYTFVSRIMKKGWELDGWEGYIGMEDGHYWGVSGSSTHSFRHF